VHEPKHGVILLALLRTDRDDALELLTAGAADEKIISKQPKVQMIEIKERGTGLRIGNMKPIIRMISTMRLVIDNTEVGFLLSNSNVDSKCLAARYDATMKTFKDSGGVIRLARHAAREIVAGHE
jgi:hypothetical protein